jgi:flagellar biosynthetic protein FliR
VPLFSYRSIPAVHKIGFAFFLALVSFQAIEKPPQLDVDGVYMMLAMKEALIGLLLGLIAYMMISPSKSPDHSSIFKWDLRWRM